MSASFRIAEGLIAFQLRLSFKRFKNLKTMKIIRRKAHNGSFNHMMMQFPPTNPKAWQLRAQKRGQAAYDLPLYRSAH